MEELLLVNPRARRKSRKPRTAAQRAATRRMIAANRARRGSNPAPRRRKAHHVAAPVRHRRRRNPIAKAHSSYRRRRRHNPIGGGVTALLKSAFLGAAGAVTVNAAYNYLPIPATLKTGYTGYAVKGALAVALAMVGKRFLGARAVKMAEGSLTVTLTTVLADLGSKAGMNLSGVGYASPAIQFQPRPAVGYQAPGMHGMNEYVDSGMGEYVY